MISVRDAAVEDTALILSMIRELAEYERLSDCVAATEATLREQVFELGRAGVLIAQDGGEPIGYALWFRSFSTFVGRSGIYLEDLFVRPSARGRGAGKAMLSVLARKALANGAGCRLEWSCLDWNAPSIAFYRSLGAEPMSGWTTYRLSGEPLLSLAAENR